MKNNMTRREFTISAILSGTGVLFLSSVKNLSASLIAQTSEYASLNDHQVKTLEAMC